MFSKRHNRYCNKELYKLYYKPCDTYKMVSITLKEFERRSDDFLQPTSEKSIILCESAINAMS